MKLFLSAKLLLGILLLFVLLIGFASSDDLNAIDLNSNDLNENEFTADLNALNDLNQNNADENTSDLNTLIPKIIFVYPLENQILKGIELIVVSLQNFGELVSYLFSFNGTEFEGILSENSLTADLNTLQFDNNAFELKANVCDKTECISNSIIVNIENELIQETEPETIQASYSVIPSNADVALSVFDSEENLVDSGTEQVLVKKGIYNAKLTFLEGSIESISLNEVLIDSDTTLVEADEKISLNLSAPEKTKWNKIVAVKPNAEFSSGELKLKVPKESEFLFKCAEWNYYEKKCDGSWNKIMDLSNEQTVSIPFTPLDPGYGFAKKENLISFDRLVDCPKCGQHKVSPKTNVLMTVTAESSEEIQNGILEEYFPVEWEIVITDGGIVSDYDSEFGKISWDIGTFTGEISKTYQI
ncbi:MAG: hypothetical protein ABH986_04545, partial [archaeon]